MNNIEMVKTYEDKLKELILLLQKMSDGNNDFTEVQKEVENKLMEFDHHIDEECMKRIITTHQLNMAYINKLKMVNFNFNLDKPMYDNIISNTSNLIKNINLN